jgi:hypothetical protein
MAPAIGIIADDFTGAVMVAGMLETRHRLPGPVPSRMAAPRARARWWPRPAAAPSPRPRRWTEDRRLA